MASSVEDGTKTSGYVIETTIRVGLVLLLLYWCYWIARPFIIPAIWGIIIAIATMPLHRWLLRLLGGRNKLAASLLTIVALLVLLVPVIELSRGMIASVGELVDALNNDTLKVPAPPESVATWPLIGEPLNEIWSLASVNLQAALDEIAPQLRSAGIQALSFAAATGMGVLQFLIAIVIAGVLLAHSDAGHRVSLALATRLAGKRGAGMVELAEDTIRSVTRGILGTAIIQSGLAGLGMFVAGVPAAALLTLIALLLCVIQIGPTLILIPAIVYIFINASTPVAVAFLVWCIVVAMSDNVLKPLLMRGGSDVPIVVIIVGVIGGMLSHGLIGIFVGPVVVAVGFKLLQAWMSEPKAEAQSAV